MKKLLLVVLAMCLAFALVSCSKGEGKPGSIAAIKKAGKIRMLTNATYPPYEYVKGNGFDGLDIALGKLIAEKLGVQLEIIDMNFDLLIDAVNTDKGDFIAAGMSVTEERKKIVEFTNTYSDNPLVVAIPVNSTIKDVKELANKKIAVQEATTADIYTTDNLIGKGGEVMRFKDAVVAGAALGTGKADAFLMNKDVVLMVLNNYKGKLKILDGFLVDTMKPAMVTKKGNTELAEFINKTLDEPIKSGKVEELKVFYVEDYAKIEGK